MKNIPQGEATIEDYKEVIADHQRLVKEMDVIMNGKFAAKQASLCDLVGQIKELKRDNYLLKDEIQFLSKDFSMEK